MTPQSLKDSIKLQRKTMATISTSRTSGRRRKVRGKERWNKVRKGMFGLTITKDTKHFIINPTITCSDWRRDGRSQRGSRWRRWRSWCVVFTLSAELWDPRDLAPLWITGLQILSG